MSFLRGRNTFGATQQPWEVIVEVLESDVSGNPTLWVGSDNGVYGYGDDGQIYDFTDEYLRAINAKPAGLAGNPYGRNTQSTGFGGGFGNTGFGAGSPAVTVGGNNTPAVTVGGRVRMNSSTTETTTTQSKLTNKELIREVIKDFKPRPGSEMIPLYDPETEIVEAILYRETKEFELKVRRK